MEIYHIEKEFTSQATNVIFVHEIQTKRPACLKIWLPCDNGIYRTTDLKLCNDYFMEGLKFNRHFAPGVYLGLARFITRDDLKHEVRCGRLITKPRRHQLKDDYNYTLIMNRLDDATRLDRQLSSEKIGNFRGMEFLAEAIADMHKRLKQSSSNMGTPTSLAGKLHLNQQKFMEALHKVRKKTEFATFKQRIGRKGLSSITSACSWLEGIAEIYKHVFEHRYQAKKIRRCHGDLKATNVWLNPEGESKQDQLLFLDCVDFNPEFCHIDTLSDVAMMAVDLEMYLTHSPDGSQSVSKKLVQHFLYTYLQAANESEAVWPLLEYYMVEKAMVGAYTYILFDRQPSLGEQYLDIVLTHSQKLQYYLPLSMNRGIHSI
jgi:aminoglycoside phosphotransferase family enzyme